MAHFAYGFSWRKLRFLRQFLATQVHAVSDVAKLREGDALYLWGSAPVPSALPAGVVVRRVEDGFLRSVGLGAGLAAPLSWVVDDQGLYYDPRQASRLETILSTAAFSPALQARAALLRQRIIENGLSKYNVGQRGAWRRTASRTTLLVPGQVEDDASIRLGAVGVSTNMALLRAVREANPEAHIVYKPHPDVVHGLRQAQDAGAEVWADEVVTGASIHDLLQQVDGVHVMTSLTGFEALLRGVPVTCYGQPFYAGWGLTEDLQPHPRRTRILQLDELVAGALILYPLYLHPATLQPATVEDVVSGLIEQAARPPAWQDRARLKLMQLLRV